MSRPVRPTTARSASISPITGANLKLCPEHGDACTKPPSGWNTPTKSLGRRNAGKRVIRLGASRISWARLCRRDERNVPTTNSQSGAPICRMAVTEIIDRPDRSSSWRQGYRRCAAVVHRTGARNSRAGSRGSCRASNRGHGPEQSDRFQSRAGHVAQAPQGLRCP